MIDSVYIELYHTDIAFLVECSLMEFDRFYYDNVTKITDDEYKIIKRDITDEKLCNGATYPLDSGLIIIYLRHADYVGDVAHEIFHACNMLMCRVGMTHDDCAEPWAYLIGYVTERYYDMIYPSDANDVGKKNKKKG